MVQVADAAHKAIEAYARVNPQVAERLKSDLRTARNLQDIKPAMSSVMKTFQTVYLLRQLDQNETKTGIESLLQSAAAGSETPYDDKYTTDLVSAVDRLAYEGRFDANAAGSDRAIQLMEWVASNVPDQIARPRSLLTRFRAQATPSVTYAGQEAIERIFSLGRAARLEGFVSAAQSYKIPEAAKGLESQRLRLSQLAQGMPASSTFGQCVLAARRLGEYLRE